MVEELKFVKLVIAGSGAGLSERERYWLMREGSLYCWSLLVRETWVLVFLLCSCRACA